MSSGLKVTHGMSVFFRRQTAAPTGVKQQTGSHHWIVFLKVPALFQSTGDWMNPLSVTIFHRQTQNRSDKEPFNVNSSGDE